MPILRVVFFVIALSAALVTGFLFGKRSTQSAPSFATPSAYSQSAQVNNPTLPSGSAPTQVYAHNLLLRKGPNFRVYVRWLRGNMARAKHNVNPSFDDPESFYLDIKSGVLRANIGDLANFLNTGLTNSPLRNVKLSGDGDQIRLNGTLHKGIPVPIELIGTISATPDSRVQVHVAKLSVLKVPFKGLLGLFHVSLSDLFKDPHISGLQVIGNDLFFDTQTLLPPPHIRGALTKVHIVNPDLEEIFGNGEEASDRVEEWRNFLRLNEGTIDFGKLTMHHVDLIMIDISKDAWFDLDLSNYQTQLVNGYTRITPQAALQIFMPDRRDIPASQAKVDLGIEWFKHRDLPPPPGVTKR